MGLKKDSGGSIAERTIDHIRVASDPANVSHTCIHISRSVVKHILHKVEINIHSLFVRVRERLADLLCDGGIKEVASLSVEDALWLASGA